MFRFYHSVRPKNPYYRLRAKKQWPWGRIILFVSIAFVVAFGILMFSSAFAITEIRIEGASMHSANDIRAAVGEGISSRSRLLVFRTDGVERRLKEQFGLVSVEVEKNYPHTLFVRIVERVPRAVWQTTSHVWLIDQEGRAVGEMGLDAPRRTELVYFFDESGTAPDDGKFISPERLAVALLVGERLGKERSLEVLFIKLQSPVDSFAKYVTGEGWELFIDLASDLDVQLEKLDTVLLQIGDARGTLHYIDVRFADRVYYQ